MEKTKKVLKGRKAGCRHPHHEKKDPQDFSPGEIRECHPEAKGHPCVRKVKRESQGGTGGAKTGCSTC